MEDNWARPSRFYESTFQEKKQEKKKAERQDLESEQRKKYKSFLIYTRNIFKESLITSIPEIATTSSWFKRIIKIIVFCLCAIGFVIQTADFLKLYWSYPTVVNIEVSSPFKVVQPAITVCNRNLVRRSVYCNVTPDACAWFSEDDFCIMYEKSCPDTAAVATGVPHMDAFVDANMQWLSAFRYAHTESIILSCSKNIEGKTIPCVKPFNRVPFTNNEGRPNLCYTIESQWGKPDDNPDIYPNTFSFTIIFNMEPEEYTIFTQPVNIQMAVHDRRMLVNPYSEGYLLTGGNVYTAYISMNEKESLPAPYNANCTDYITLWKKRNGTGPLNEMMCVEECKLNTLKKSGLCIDGNVAYPHTEKLCKPNEFSLTSTIVEKCTKECGPACWDSSYELKIERIDNYDSICSTDWCRMNTAKIDIYFKKFRVTKFKYEPKFESVEMFSYIGGYMGMWLGLSLISLFDLFETFVQIAYFPLGRHIWITKKKKKEKFAVNGRKVSNNQLRSRRSFDYPY